MKQLEVEIVFTPKTYCEIAGRGIEHEWGVAKMMFYKENSTQDNDKRANPLKIRVKNITIIILIMLESANFLVLICF